MKINCIVIDDTPLAVEKLEGFIYQIPFMNLLKSFTNAIDALLFMKTIPVELVFLDIQMEQFTGLQFLEALQKRPQIIIVSAYSQYAIHGFEYSVTDYLLKPYSFERFLKAIEKVQLESNIKQQTEYFFVKTEHRMERINFADILYIEGQGAYLRIVMLNAKIMTLLSFQQMDDMLPKDNFKRIHKSYIIALNKIESIERNVVKIADQRIPIGLSFKESFYNALKIKE